MKFSAVSLILVATSLLLGYIPLGEASHGRAHLGEKELRGRKHVEKKRTSMKLPPSATSHTRYPVHQAAKSLHSSLDGSESSESSDSTSKMVSRTIKTPLRIPKRGFSLDGDDSSNSTSTFSLSEEESSPGPPSPRSFDNDRTKVVLRFPTNSIPRHNAQDKAKSKTPAGQSIPSLRAKGNSPMPKGQRANDGESFKVQLRVPVPTKRSETNNVDKIIKGSSQRALEHHAKQYVAMDCEMVGVGPNGKRSALARVSIVDFFGKVLYDTFVKPAKRVTDYRTQYSGVTKSDLENALDFKTAQTKVKQLLKGKILVGHAIDNDLRALRLQHPSGMVKDTSLHPPFVIANGGKTPALRKLAEKHLSLKIQQGPNGHDSVEDARVAMILYHQILTADRQ